MLRNPTRPDWSDNPATAFRLVRMAGGAVRMRAGADGDADDSESSSESEQRRTADGVVARDPFDVFVVRPFPSGLFSLSDKEESVDDGDEGRALDVPALPASLLAGSEVSSAQWIPLPPPLPPPPPPDGSPFEQRSGVGLF